MSISGKHDFLQNNFSHHIATALADSAAWRPQDFPIAVFNAQRRTHAHTPKLLGAVGVSTRYRFALFDDFSPNAFKTCNIGSQASSNRSMFKSLFAGLLPVNHKSYS